LLGFKLRFYASPARDASDTLPDNLIYLAALLIKVGFISLRDLYPHLYPHDDKMAEVQEKLMREKAEREKLSRPGGGARNALAMAGALADDTLPGMGRPRDFTSNRGAAVKPDGAAEKSGATPAKVDEEKKDELPEPTDQKISLLKSLLCIGAIPESLYMLGKFPWLPDVLPDLPEYVHRIAHHMLSKVYEPARPLRDRSSVQVAKKQVADQAGQPKGILRLADPPSRKTLRWAQLDRGDMGDGVAYRFYWDDWTDNVPICQTVNDVFQLCGTFLNYSGVKIGQDPTLLTKLTRIGKKSLSDDPSKENHARWIDLSKRLLVPALSLTKNNPGVVNEMFDLLKCFSIATRYSIYAEWYSGQISRLPDIKAAFDQARAETKDVLKRISKDNTKSMARALAKVAYASPGIVFSVAINQMEAYDNLIEVVV
ncbi:THO2 plays a role in transcriptional elongation, partial [Cryomyces antarcticus]